MSRSTKLAELKVVETSGVDHPAHLHEGWLVIKSATLAETSTETQGDNVELNITEETIEAPVEPVVETVATADIEKAAAQHEAIVKELTDLRKQLDDVRKENDSLLATRELEKATESAHGWAILPEMNPAEFAPALVELRKALPAVAEKIEAVFSASARALGESNILKEVGSDSAPKASGDAWSQIEAMANDLVATGEANTFAKAVSVVASRNKDLYATYINEKGI